MTTEIISPQRLVSSPSPSSSPSHPSARLPLSSGKRQWWMLPLHHQPPPPHTHTHAHTHTQPQHHQTAPPPLQRPTLLPVHLTPSLSGVTCRSEWRLCVCVCVWGGGGGVDIWIKGRWRSETFTEEQTCGEVEEDGSGELIKYRRMRRGRVVRFKLQLNGKVATRLSPWSVVQRL